MKEYLEVKYGLPPPHKTVLALCDNGDIYQARVCYGLHLPFWHGHSKLNFGKVLSDEGLTVTHWKAMPKDE